MAAVDDLIAERDRLSALLSTLPVAQSVSEGGRSIGLNRKDILDQIKELNELIVQLQGPFVIHSGVAPGW